jgi:hypothetical protein
MSIIGGYRQVGEMTGDRTRRYRRVFAQEKATSLPVSSTDQLFKTATVIYSEAQVECQARGDAVIAQGEKRPGGLPVLIRLDQEPPAYPDGVASQHVTEMMLVAIHPGDANKRGRGGSHRGRHEPVVRVQAGDDRTDGTGVSRRKGQAIGAIRPTAPRQVFERLNHTLRAE